MKPNFDHEVTDFFVPLDSGVCICDLCHNQFEINDFDMLCHLAENHTDICMIFPKTIIHVGF
jgi:hypothetical protein